MAMHPIDSAIYDNTVTTELLAEHAARELPPVGHSYWGDAMRRVRDPRRAARIAAREMGAALASLQAVSR